MHMNKRGTRRLIVYYLFWTDRSEKGLLLPQTDPNQKITPVKFIKQITHWA